METGGVSGAQGKSVRRCREAVLGGAVEGRPRMAVELRVEVDVRIGQDFLGDVEGHEGTDGKVVGRAALGAHHIGDDLSLNRGPPAMHVPAIDLRAPTPILGELPGGGVLGKVRRSPGFSIAFALATTFAIEGAYPRRRRDGLLCVPRPSGPELRDQEMWLVNHGQDDTWDLSKSKQEVYE